MRNFSPRDKSIASCDGQAPEDGDLPQKCAERFLKKPSDPHMQRPNQFVWGQDRSVGSGTRDSAVAPQRLTCGQTFHGLSSIAACIAMFLCTNRPVGDQCQPGLRDSCKVPKFTRHQQPFCDSLCRGLLSR